LLKSMKLFRMCTHKAALVSSSKAHRFRWSFARRISLHCRVYAAYGTTPTESGWESSVIWTFRHGSSRKPMIFRKVSQNRANPLICVNSISALRDGTQSRNHRKKW
jgi:hypothetical protein